jgi:hypothetical protein
VDPQELISDKVNVHTSKSGEETCSLLIDKGWFKESIEVFRSAIAYALANQMEPKTDVPTGGRNWNAGSVDKDGSVSAVLALHGYKDRPMATAEGLAEVALEDIGKRVRKGESLSQIFLN